MKLTILGSNGPYPSVGGACSGYLLEDNDTRILIDCGNGVLSRLLQVCAPEQLDAIILSHLHSDHMSDILVLKYAIGIKKMMGMFDGSVALYTPWDDEDLINRLNYNEAFSIFQINEDVTISINDLMISFKRTIHPMETYAVKIQKKNKVFVYSADTAYNEDIIGYIQNSDLFLCEAGVLEKDRKEATPHLSARQAGELATKSDVKRLILTHFWPEYSLESIMNEAKESYSSDLELAEDMKVYCI